MAVISGEGNGEDIVIVADKALGRDASGELPQAESLVPRSGECVGTVGGNDLIDYQLAVADSPAKYSLHSRKQCESGRVSFVLADRNSDRHV